MQHKEPKRVYYGEELKFLEIGRICAGGVLTFGPKMTEGFLSEAQTEVSPEDPSLLTEEMEFLIMHFFERYVFGYFGPQKQEVFMHAMIKAVLLSKDSNLEEKADPR